MAIETNGNKIVTSQVRLIHRIHIFNNLTVYFRPFGYAGFHRADTTQYVFTPDSDSDSDSDMIYSTEKQNDTCSAESVWKEEHIHNSVA